MKDARQLRAKEEHDQGNDDLDQMSDQDQYNQFLAALTPEQSKELAKKTHELFLANRADPNRPVMPGSTPSQTSAEPAQPLTQEQMDLLAEKKAMAEALGFAY
jgi:hypothetical protein